MEYPEDALIRMKEYDEGNKEALDWLLKNNFKELIATVDAIHGSDAAESWLESNKYIMLFAFTKAVWDDEGAFVFLLKHKFTDWAAMANIVNGDQKAYDIFFRLKKKVKLELAVQLRNTKRDAQNRGSLLFNALNIFKK
jgi:hypothetical protein